MKPLAIASLLERDLKGIDGFIPQGFFRVFTLLQGGTLRVVGLFLFENNVLSSDDCSVGLS